MRKKIIYLLTAVSLGLGISCSDKLDVNPVQQISTEKLYETVDGAWAAMNGIYRGLAKTGWTEGNLHQASGLASNQLAIDLMGEDMVMRERGAYGWYWNNYCYQVRDVTFNNSFLPYEIWNMWYWVINQSNEILAYAPKSEGSVEERNSVLAQAYAMRSFAYFNLIRWFQRTYAGHEDAPGVPIYTVPAGSDVKGAGRGTVRKVYQQINDDLDSAFVYFEHAASQKHLSHIDKYVAYGIRSRVALTQENWAVAAEAARQARQKEGVQLMNTTELFSGFNSVNNPEWMWGIEITDSQTSGLASLWSHMDARLPMYGQSSRKIASSWIYDMIHPLDIRRQWFRDPASVSAQEEMANVLGPDVRYYQLKYKVPNLSSLAGDFLYMRAAEMYLNEAEARCHLGEFGEVRRLLMELVSYKYEEKDVYEAILKTYTDSDEQTLKSTESLRIRTLLDEVLLQRRIELWGEGFRMFDIIRLKTGFNRNYTTPVSNHPVEGKFQIEPDSWRFVLMIPDVEFEGNVNLDKTQDQNPAEF